MIDRERRLHVINLDFPHDLHNVFVKFSVVLQFDCLGKKLISIRTEQLFLLLPTVANKHTLTHTHTHLTSLLHASCLLELATFFLGLFHNILSWL